MNSPGIAAARRAEIAAEGDLDELRAAIRLAVDDAVARFQDRTGCRGPSRIYIRVGYSGAGEPRAKVVDLRMPP